MRIDVNGQTHELDAPPEMPLLWALRDLLSLTGTKFGCGAALCGACTVHVDGQPVRACVTPLSALVGKKVTTIEAIGATALGRKVQDAWVAEDVPQCGYCQSGQIMSAVALLAATPKPTDEDINTALNGNLCRCGTYNRIRKAIHRAAAGPA
jgi:isoquinoline 1-oxidoreductase alpha subunit